MLMLGSLIGLLVMGMAVDTTALGRTTDEDGDVIHAAELVDHR